MLFDDDQGFAAESRPQRDGRDERPLAERVRPEDFGSIYGQDKIFAPGAPLRKLVEADRFHALIFWGPPGSGKTSLAALIGRQAGRRLAVLSAVHAGVKEIRAALAASEDDIKRGGRAHLMFMDEVHRLNKGQQDSLLPALEGGLIKFIGATTENPSFEVNNAINSRALVFRLEKIAPEAMVKLLARALSHPQGGLEGRQVEPEALAALAQSAGGDARRALNLLEAVLVATSPAEDPVSVGALELLHHAFPTLLYDRQGDEHYDAASALIKSIRASHPDAALYYLARMLEAGEDPMFLARRLVIAAAEDIGNANPHALNFAVAASQAVHQVGMPEARIVLAQICTLLASSPKSNRSYLGIDKALADVRKHGALPIPYHLRNAPTAMMKGFGYGKGYAYAHSDRDKAREATYLPEELAGTRYYEPGEEGFEVQIRQTLARLRPLRD